MKNRIKQVLDGILDRFKSGDIPEAVAYAMYPMADDIPSAKWSIALVRWRKGQGSICWRRSCAAARANIAKNSPIS